MIHKIDRSHARLAHLFDVPEPPENLWIETADTDLSVLISLPDRGLAIVGPRLPQERARSLVRRVTASLRDSQLCIVSGFARGIDAEAHIAALRTGLPTVAILGCGLDINYPAHGRSLKREIIEGGGAVVTEYAPGTVAFASHFLHRNRLIAAWTKATWMVQAREKSGALNTASWCQKLDRTLFVTPCFPDDPSFEGNQRLLSREGAWPLFSRKSLEPVWLDLIRSTEKQEQATEDSPSEILEVLDEFLKNGETARKFFDSEKSQSEQSP